MPISSRTRHALHMSVSRYEPPAEQDELVHDQLVAQQQQQQKEQARSAANRQDLPFSTPGPGRAIGTGVGQMQMPRRAPSWRYTTANAHGHGHGLGVGVGARPAIVEEPLREDGVVNYASPAVGAGMNVGVNGGGVSKRWSSGALPSLAQGMQNPYLTPASSAARQEE
ncbi:hypothetical protein KEM55_005477 [Ascosphaera atra]|nr:hypothetical protein KEM55_005477 [Ascosphaera atra]